MAATRKSKLRSGMLSVTLALVAATTTLAPKPAHAVLASEFTQILNQVQLYLQQINSVTEYGEEAMRWKRTLQQYQQQLIDLKHSIMGFGMPNGLSMEKVADNYGVVQRCGGGFNLASVVQGFVLNASGNLLEQRKKICASIQIANNRKYNETIDFVKITIPQLEQSLASTNARRDSSKDPGVMEASQYDALTYANTFDTRYKGWQIKMKTYDEYIHAMQIQQMQLTELGLKGEISPLGTLVKTAALKSALQFGN